MTARRHLFLATGRAAFGEAVVGLELARALHDAGDAVGFLYPSTLTRLFRDQPFSRATVDVAELDLPAAVSAAVRERGFETLVLVDVTAVVSAAGPRAARALVGGAGARVIGLDLWNLPVTDLVWDVGESRVGLDPLVREIPCLRPCPFAGPDAEGAYRALPAVAPLAGDERARIRAEVGAGEDDRLLLTTTAAWQLPALQHRASTRRLAAAIPEALALVDRRLDARTRWVHVGQEPPARMARCHATGPLDPAAFRRLLAAADALVSLNLAGTSVAAAVAAEVPVVVLTSSARGDTVDEAAAGRTLAADVRAWLASVVPVHPFRVCPVGLHAFLAPVIAASGLGAAVLEAELCDPDAAAEAIAALTGDPVGPERAAATRARAELRARSAALPSAVERFRDLAG